MLWLALIFPKLPLEAQSERAMSRQTAAGAFVVEQGHVCVVDDAAAAAGVMPGMRFSTARGILPEALVMERDATAIARERQTLAALACFCGNVTPTVCIDHPATLLLEIGGCLRLFGGVAPIVAALLRGCAERGISVRTGVAPTPRGAEWLAHGAASNDNAATCCLMLEALPDMLAGLSLDVLAVRPEVMRRLQAFGARRLGDLMALPRAGLARRIGLEPVDQLLQATGELPDPRAPLVFPEHFRLAIELPAPVTDAAMLGFVARRLIVDFCGWLAARQAGATGCTLLLTPERRGLPVQRLELRLSAGSRDPIRFQRLLRERLDRTPLAAPVGEIILEAGATDQIIALPGQNASLLDARQPAAPLDVLLERLRARLGEGAVHGLRIHPDHRPECATHHAAVGFSDVATGPLPAVMPLRPLCLIEPPEALTEVDGRPARRGEVLELLGGAERIESGWWDDGDVRRDYFLARSRHGEVWWVFRDMAGWWAQGTGFACASVGAAA